MSAFFGYWEDKYNSATPRCTCLWDLKLSCAVLRRVEMVTEAIRFMLEAIGIEMSRAPFSIEPDGDCLYNTLAFIANPTFTKEESAEKGTATRQAVMEEAIEVISAMSSERLVPILAAAVSDKGKPVTREELLAMLDRYRQNGQWDSGLGDLGPQLCASFTRTPLFVIWIDLISKKTTGYFVNPAHVFNQPEHESVPRVVVRMNNHYEPLLLPAEANEALVAIYRHTQTQQMQMAAIQLPVRSSGEVAMGGNEDRNAMLTSTSEDDGVEQRQQRQDDRGICAGN